MVKLTAPQQEVFQEITSGEYLFVRYEHSGKEYFKRYQRLADGQYVTAVNRTHATPTVRALIKKGVVTVGENGHAVVVPTEPAEAKAEPAPAPRGAYRVTTYASHWNPTTQRQELMLKEVREVADVPALRRELDAEGVPVRFQDETTGEFNLGRGWLVRWAPVPPANLIPGGKVVARFLKEGDLIERGGEIVRIAGKGRLEVTGPRAGRMYFPGYMEDGELVVFTLNPALWVELYDAVTDEEFAAHLGQEGS